MIASSGNIRIDEGSSGTTAKNDIHQGQPVIVGAGTRWIPLTWLRSGVGLRLLASVVLFSSAVTLVLTALQFYLDYDRAIGVIDNRLDEIERSSLGSLAESLWNLDQNQLQLQLNGILRLPDIGFAEVRETDAAGAPLTVTAGQRGIGSIIAREFPLFYVVEGDRRSIGVVTVEASRTEIYRTLTERALVILASQGAKTFLVSFFIIYIFHLLVTRHLIRIAEYAGSYEVMHPPPPLSLRRVAPSQGDELDKVVVAFNQLCANLQGAYEKLRRSAHEQREAEERLRQSQKMEAIGQLTGGIAHDFNNILTVISGTIDILADGVADRPPLAAVVEMIDEASTRGADLTQRLLAFARKQQLRPRPTDVNALVIETAKLLRPALGERVEIVSMLAGEEWPAMVDPSQLPAALLNLAVNARDAMPDGGKLTLTTANVVLDEADARVIPEAKPGRYVVIAVSDTGTGIPAALRDKVLEPFFTTKQVGKGTGLGLSMVYGFVKQSGGHVVIDSEEGRGTKVELYLPASGDQPRAGAAPATAAATVGGHETILVVEDDTLVRNYVVAQLHSLGYATIAAASGKEALAVIDAGPAVDLLFTDVVMPGGMNGRQLADEVATRLPAVKVLYTSGYTENAIVHHGRLDCGIALLSKPYRKADLARKIREALGG